MTAPRPGKSTRASQTAARLWLARFGIALLVGLAIGGGAGVVAVNTLEPGRPNSVDSVQAILDSIARGRIPPADPAAKPAPEPEPERASAPVPDTVPSAEEQVVVPAMVDLEEGAARNAILDAGLQVGEVKFQASTKPAGTVIGTAPAAGIAVARNSAVALVLSDGRPPTDTMSSPLPFSRSDFKP